MTPAETQTFRNLANKITSTWVAKLNSQMLSELVVTVHYMACELPGFGIAAPVMEKIRSRLEIVRPIDYNAYRYLLMSARDTMFRKQDALSRKVGFYLTSQRVLKETMSRQLPVEEAGRSGEWFIIDVVPRPDAEQIDKLLLPVKEAYEELKKQICTIDDETLSRAIREALFSRSLNEVFQIVDILPSQCWKEIKVKNAVGMTHVIDAEVSKLGLAFTAGPTPNIRFSQHRDIVAKNSEEWHEQVKEKA